MNNLITNKYLLNDGSNTSNSSLPCLDVIYGSDENYQFGAGVSAVSLLINNPNTLFRFHYFLDKVSPSFLERLKVISHQFPAEFHIYELDNQLLKTLPVSDIWSSAMYFRLVALDYLSKDYDVALYLDADVICNGQLNLAADLIKDKVCGVIADDIGVRTKSETRLHTPKLAETYFNSGVMFVNLKKWHEKRVTQQCFELLSAENAKQRFKYPDQDVLNLILRNDLILLNQKFNTVYTLKNELYDRTHQKYQTIITPETVLIHYTGVSKPWHKWANYPSSQPFYKALAQSPWTKDDLKCATKFAERKKEYKHLLKQGSYLSGILSGIYYLFEKHTKKENNMMINKIVLTVSPIFSIPPKSAAAIESWMYNVAKRLDIENRIVCIRNDGYSAHSVVNEYCEIERIKFGKVYTRLFKKWVRLDPYSYADRIVKIKHQFSPNPNKSVIFVHNHIKSFKKIIKKEGHNNVVLHMHNLYEPKDVPEDIKIIVPSHFMKNWYRERLPNALIEVVRNGFDGEIYAQPPEVKREDFGLTAEDKIVLFAGRIVRDKGLLELMRACETFFKEDPRYKLVIVGDPNAALKGELAQYQDEVKDYAKNLGEQCIFLGGVHPEKIRHYYSLADVIAVPSIAPEPFCMVALEAMASGRPVIASQRGAMVEFISHNETGFIFREPLSPLSMAEDITSALNHPNSQEIAYHAKKHAYDNFTWEIVKDELMGVIAKWYS